MDLQSFIQSGLLEAYVLGQCTAEERALAERMVAEYAEVRAELAAVEQALESYASANAVPPPAWMKGRILERIENEAVPLAAPPVSSNFYLRIFQLLTLALALLGGFLLFQKNNLVSEKTTLENRVAELQKQIEACAEQEKLKEKLQQVNLLLRHTDTRDVPLANVTNTTLAAHAYHNTTSCEVAIDLNSLPAPEQGKFFQFWSIVDGKPVSMGMVDVGASGGWQVIACQQNAVALAISLENNPLGNPAPTEVFMVGNIPAG
jgi:anti-sigma-K factor RskA